MNKTYKYILQKISYYYERYYFAISYILYLGRWQLSTPLLFVCIVYLPFDDATKTIIANLIGGLFFFWIDRFIFTKKEKKVLEL